MWEYAGRFMADQWRVAVNFAVIATTQITIAIMAQNVVQKRKHSLKLLIGYWFLKMLILDLFLAVIMGGYMETHEGFHAFYMVLKTLISITNFFVMYYTYEGGIVKTALFGMGTEIFSVTVGSIPLFVIYEDNVDMQIAYLYPVGWKSLLFVAMSFLIFAAVRLLFGKYLIKLRNYKIRHKKFWMSLFVIYVLCAIYQSVLGYQTTIISPYILNMLIVAAAGAAVAFAALNLYMQYRQQIFRENEFLKMRRHLMTLHMEAVREQILYMESQQRLINAQMEEIRKLELSGDMSGRIEKYLEMLKESYSTLQAGLYSDDFLVDAILYHYGQSFTERGVHPEFSFGNYQKGSLKEEDAAEILLDLLEAAMAEIERTEPENRFLRLQGGTVKNQTVFRMECSWGTGRLWRIKKGGASAGMLRRCVNRLGGQMKIIREEDCIQTEVVLAGRFLKNK